MLCRSVLEVFRPYQLSLSAPTLVTSNNTLSAPHCSLPLLSAKPDLTARHPHRFLASSKPTTPLWSQTDSFTHAQEVQEVRYVLRTRHVETGHSLTDVIVRRLSPLRQA